MLDAYARPDPREGRGHAVVIGASIAGLLAARVLAEHFDRVTVLDRDRLDGTGHRRGAAQGQHLHGLMERGRRIMEDLFPGLTAEVGSQGAPTTEVLVRSRWYLSGLRAYPTPTGLTTLLATRPLLESVIRSRVAVLVGVTVRDRTMAIGLIGADRITGVRVRQGERIEALDADLVVDASGRGSRAVQWLTALGHPGPVEERVDVDLGYGSRTYRRRPDQLDGDLGVVVSTMPGRRGGGAIAVEGDRWHVTLGGMLGDHPPTDGAGFLAFAQTLPVPDIHRLIVDAEPLDEPVPFRFRGSVRRHFQRVATPAGFLALGDAVCCFNPLYAQGMTVAAQQAVALADSLAEDSADGTLPARFYRRAVGDIDVAWQMSVGADLHHPGVQGRRTVRTRVVNAYVQRAHRAAHVDPVVARTFMRLANLVDPPSTLLTPSMVMRVLRRGG